METGQPAPENPNNQETLDEQAAIPVRSYDCTFCKRGFSNAQALGGHMNIHRKDKAKFKQTAASSNKSNQQSLDVSKIRASYSPIPINRIRPSFEVKAASQERRTTNWCPWVSGEEKDATESEKTQLGQVQKLPLFVERPLRIEQNLNPEGSQVIHAEGTEILELSSSSSEADFDLELRLGIQRRDSSSSTGTKKFF